MRLFVVEFISVGGGTRDIIYGWTVLVATPDIFHMRF